MVLRASSRKGRPTAFIGEHADERGKRINGTAMIAKGSSAADTPLAGPV
jgi:hypothetical protein